MRRAGRKRIRGSLLVLSFLLTFFFSFPGLSQARPEAAPGPVASHPTKISATVKSIKLLRSLVELSEEANLGEDFPKNVKIYSVKLSIGNAEPVKAGEPTSVQPKTEVKVLTRDPIKQSFVGKKITGIIETRGDTRQRSLLLTNVLLVTTKENPRHINKQEK